MKNLLDKWIAHPLTRGFELDDPRTTTLRREIIASKPFLRAIYVEWYKRMASAASGAPGPVLELGSGGGFLDQMLPKLITSEPFFSTGIRLAADGCSLPFAAASLGAIVLVDVLHHLPRPDAFFSEAERCLRPSGSVAMIEPWVTPFARFVWQFLHHEPFESHVPHWDLPKAGPLSGANSALPWIVFCRDRARLERLHPGLTIESIRPFMPLAYLLSGGVSTRLGLPGCCYRPLRAFEKAVEGLAGNACCLFAEITLRKSDK